MMRKTFESLRQELAAAGLIPQPTVRRKIALEERRFRYKNRFDISVVYLKPGSNEICF